MVRFVHSGIIPSRSVGLVFTKSNEQAAVSPTQQRLLTMPRTLAIGFSATVNSTGLLSARPFSYSMDIVYKPSGGTKVNTNIRLRGGGAVCSGWGWSFGVTDLAMGVEGGVLREEERPSGERGDFPVSELSPSFLHGVVGRGKVVVVVVVLGRAGFGKFKGEGVGLRGLGGDREEEGVAGATGICFGLRGGAWFDN